MLILVCVLIFAPLFFVPSGVMSWSRAIASLSFNSTMKGVVIISCMAILGVLVSCALCKYRRKPLLPISKLWILLAYSSCISLSFNHYVYSSAWMIPASIFSCMAAICFSYAIFRRVAILFWLPLLFISFVQIACWYRFDNKLNAFLLQETLHANADEVLNFLTPTNCIIVVLGLLFICLMCYAMYKICNKMATSTLLFSGSVSLLLYGIACLLLAPRVVHISAFWPAFEIRNVHQLFGEAAAQEARILQRVTDLPSPADKPYEITAVQPGDGVVCILHIGESVRSDRLGINGWKNNTTPRIAQRKELINFKTCIASAPSTCAAFVGILTNCTGNVQQEHVDASLPSVGSLMDFFSSEDFSSAVFVHSQNVPNKEDLKLTTKSFDTTFSQIFSLFTSKVNDKFYIHDKSFEQYQQVRDYCNLHPDKNLFLLINNLGSHGPFTDYDGNAPAFTPFDSTTFYTNAASNAEAVSNAYDNTIEYQDKLIGSICEALQGRPFVYIYVSDHGELLGDDGLWSRVALSSDNAFYESPASVVPLYIAYSQEFENLNPEIKQALSTLRNNTALTISHGHVFHTILGLLGIRSEFYTEQLDLCSPNAQPYTGKQPKTN